MGLRWVGYAASGAIPEAVVSKGSSKKVAIYRWKRASDEGRALVDAHAFFAVIDAAMSGRWAC